MLYDTYDTLSMCVFVYFSCRRAFFHRASQQNSDACNFKLFQTRFIFIRFFLRKEFELLLLKLNVLHINIVLHKFKLKIHVLTSYDLLK